MINSFIILCVLLIILFGYLFIEYCKNNSFFQGQTQNIIFSPLIFFTFLLLMMFQWMQPLTKTTSFLNTALNNFKLILESIMIPEETIVVTAQVTMSKIHIFLYDLAFMFLIYLAVFGMLIGVNKKNKSQFIFILIVLTGFIFAFPHITSMYGSAGLAPNRWFVIIAIFFCVFASFSLYSLIDSAKSMKKILIALLIISLFSFANIASPKANPDSPIYTEDYNRKAFSSSELLGALFIWENSPSDKIGIDLEAAPIDENLKIFYATPEKELSVQDFEKIDARNPQNKLDLPIMIRNSILSHGYKIQIANGVAINKKFDHQQLKRKEDSGFSKIYSNSMCCIIENIT